jgi:hypothetical protein
VRRAQPEDSRLCVVVAFVPVPAYEDGVPSCLQLLDELGYIVNERFSWVDIAFRYV